MLNAQLEVECAGGPQLGKQHDVRTLRRDRSIGAGPCHALVNRLACIDGQLEQGHSCHARTVPASIPGPHISASTHGFYPRTVSTEPGDGPPPLKLESATVPELVTVWLNTLEAFADLAVCLTATAWNTPSPCPGWTAGDVVAHVLALESDMHGVPVPDHEPDWASLPHVTNAFGRYTEVPVDWYRSKGRDVVLAELREIIEWRKQDLAGLPEDPTQIMDGPGGMQLPRARMIRTRILDTWMHEQDVRTAAAIPGDLGSDGAWVTAGQFLSGLPFVWGKAVGAPIGSSLQLAITGPGVEFERTVVVADDGRARFVAGHVHEPTLRMTSSWPMYASLSGGRMGAIAEAQRGRVEFHGDFELSQRLIPALSITP